MIRVLVSALVWVLASIIVVGALVIAMRPGGRVRPHEVGGLAALIAIGSFLLVVTWLT